MLRYSREVGVPQTVSRVRALVQTAHVASLVSGGPHLVRDVETVHVHQVIVHANVVALQPVQLKSDDQIR